MKYLIFFKGDFANEVAGVAVRYLSVAEELTKKNHKVVIACRDLPQNPVGKITFISVSNTFLLFRHMMKADNIILHGGGVLVMLMASIASMVGKNVLLDAFALHWLELFSGARGKKLPFLQLMRLKLKIFFHYFRLVWARLFLNAIAVGTQRQLDLVRGIVSQVGSLDIDNGLSIITGGNDKPIDNPRDVNKDSVDFGWIGGLWDWFDETPILDAVVKLSEGGHNVKFHFFGLTKKRQTSIEKYVSGVSKNPIQDVIQFHPWVPFNERFETWSFIDVAVVWSAATVENDYASRTRNFDCITMGTPVIQNPDFFWSNLIEEHNCGLIVKDNSEIYNAMRHYSTSRVNVLEHAQNIRKLDAVFNWQHIASNYHHQLNFCGRTPRLWASIILLPLAFIFCFMAFSSNLIIGTKIDINAPQKDRKVK